VSRRRLKQPFDPAATAAFGRPLSFRVGRSALPVAPHGSSRKSVRRRAARLVVANLRFVASRWHGAGRLPTFTANASPDAPRQKDPIMRTENLFSAILTFGMLAAGAVGFGAQLLPTEQAIATLPTVTVIGHRVAEADRVTMPTVVVIGRRITPTEVAFETETVKQRVQ
jgi:hypothetical protein